MGCKLQFKIIKLKHGSNNHLQQAVGVFTGASEL